MGVNWVRIASAFPAGPVNDGRQGSHHLIDQGINGIEGAANAASSASSALSGRRDLPDSEPPDTASRRSSPGSVTSPPVPRIQHPRNPHVAPPPPIPAPRIPLANIPHTARTFPQSRSAPAPTIPSGSSAFQRLRTAPGSRVAGAAGGVAAAGSATMQLALWNRIRQAQSAHNPAIERALREPGNIGKGYLLVVYLCVSNPTGFADIWEYLESHIESSTPYPNSFAALADYRRTTRQGRLTPACHSANGTFHTFFYFATLSS